MRHAVPLPVPDPMFYIEHDGGRTVIASAFELQRIGEVAPEIDARAPEHFGLDELLQQGMSRDEAELECYVRAVTELGITDAAVPPTFPLECADHLRANGIEVHVDRELFEERRRRKNAKEIEGLRRAQHACEAALDVARAMLRNADANGVLELGGEPLTVERIKLEIERVFSAHGVVGEEF